MPSLIYINEKLTDAVYRLAVGPGDVRARLISVLPKLLLLIGSDLPAKQKKDLDWIQMKITEKNRSPYGYDDTRSLRRMRNSTGSKIAERIVCLQDEVSMLIESKKH